MTPRTSISRLADCAPVTSQAETGTIIMREAHPNMAWRQTAYINDTPAITVAEPARRRNPVATGEARGPQTDDREAAGGLDPTTYIDDTPVMRRVHAAIEAEARATAHAVIKLRARSYALRPLDLDAICCGLSRLSPARLVQMLGAISYLQPRYCGFGGEVPAINIKAASVYARYLRAKQRQGKRRAA